MKQLTVLACSIAILFLMAILEGYVISVLWGWFVAPTFGLPVLSIPIALGLSLTISATRSPHPNVEPNIERFTQLILHAPMCLLIGYIVKEFFL